MTEAQEDRIVQRADGLRVGAEMRVMVTAQDRLEAVFRYPAEHWNGIHGARRREGVARRIQAGFERLEGVHDGRRPAGLGDVPIERARIAPIPLERDPQGERSLLGGAQRPTRRWINERWAVSSPDEDDPRCRSSRRRSA